MSTKRVIIGYIIAYILSEIFIFVSVLCNCLHNGWHKMIDFAWWQIGMPMFAACIYVILLLISYLIFIRRD